MYKEQATLNNLQFLINHKTKPNNGWLIVTDFNGISIHHYLFYA